MKVKAKKNFKHQGKDVQAGDTVEMPDHEAQTHINQGNVEPHDQSDSKDPKNTGKQSGGGTGYGGSGAPSGTNPGGGSGSSTGGRF